MSVSKGGTRMQQAAAADLANILGPDGPPYDTYFSFDTKWRFNWTNYDSSYQTDFSDDNRDTYITLGAGYTQWGAWYEHPGAGNVWVRHRSGGEVTEWVGLES